MLSLRYGTSSGSTSNPRRLTLSLLLWVLALPASVSAKELFVAPDGNDGVSYANNSISNPWQTIIHGMYNLRQGDRLNIREGTYRPRYPALLKSDYASKNDGGDPSEDMLSESGSASAPVVVSSYNGERVVIDLSDVSSPYFVDLDGKSYWTFRGLDFINSTIVFRVGRNLVSTNNTFEDLRITATQGGDNYGGIVLTSSRAEAATIRNCTIVGPGTSGVHLNTSAIWLNSVNRVKILNNHLSNAPIGIYFKHRNDGSASSTDIEVAYNYIHDTPRNAINSNSNHGWFHDNVIGRNAAKTSFANDNGGLGGEDNVIEHNTFSGSGLRVEDANTATQNVVRNNIFGDRIELSRYDGVDQRTVLSHNVYPSGSSIYGHNGFISVDATSFVGQVDFVGGSSPSSVEDFTLTASSIGKGAASDGSSDIGARVHLVGPDSASIDRPKPPIVLE